MKKTLLIIIFFFFAALGYSADKKFSGQTLYVSSYPHVFVSDKKLDFKTTVTLNIRNISNNSIKIEEIKYYNGNGKLLKNYLENPMILKPMQNRRFIGISVKNIIDNAGPYFIVKWNSNKKIISPIVETMMIGASGALGISFTVPAKPIFEY